MDDVALGSSRNAARDTEDAVRQHLRSTPGDAAEQARGHVVYRHAVALRKALEDWIGTRTFRAAQQE